MLSPTIFVKTRFLATRESSKKPGFFEFLRLSRSILAKTRFLTTRASVLFMLMGDRRSDLGIHHRMNHQQSKLIPQYFAQYLNLSSE